MTDVFDRLTEYCLHGGLYNPELMQHERVRDLLIDCRTEIDRLRLTDKERQALEWAAAIAQEAVDKRLFVWEADEAAAATLRGLLERMK